MKRYANLAAMLLACGMILAAATAGLAADAPKGGEAAKVGVVSHINVLSNNVEDVSSPEAWKKTYIKDGMTDEEKALAIWKTVVKYRHQDNPPNEGFSSDNVHDPLKTIHVYGYGMCCCAASNIEGLARYIGMPARGRMITAHSVPEVWYDGAWHILDASLMAYWRNKDGKVASVDEVKASIQEWRTKHPEIKNDTDLKNYSKNDGWKQGPTVLATNLYYDKNGINSAGWHGWWSNVVEYNWKQQGNNKIVVPPDTNGAFNVFDYGAMMGYQLNVQLRHGEKITRNWFNKGLHVNGGQLPGAAAKDARKVLGLQEQFGDKAPGRVGNGTHEYIVPLADGTFRGGALTAENLASKSEGAASAVAVKDASKPGVLVIRMPSSYVYLAGKVDLSAVVGKGGSVLVSFSDNQGLDWKEVGKFEQSGAQKIDLSKLVLRRYDYRLRFELSGAGTGLDSLAISNDIQHSQAPLPLLLEGDNKITFSSGAQEGTVTYEGNLVTDNEDLKGKNLTYLDFHPIIEGIGESMMRIGDSGKGSVTFNLATPGDMTRIRMGSHFRARDPNGKDSWKAELSFDGGTTWVPMAVLEKAQPAKSDYVVFKDVPAGMQKAQLRLSGRQNNTTCMFDLRIDADYKEPQGGMAPVKVTFVWTENGVEKTESHTVTKPDETWTIKCGPKTVSKSFIVELDK